jgi:hypothetical protein
VAVIKVRRVDGENVITLPKELEARGFVPGAEVKIEPLEDGAGIAVVLEGAVPDRDRALRLRILNEERGVFERLERYDRGERP